jgi:hypothetical protein
MGDHEHEQEKRHLPLSDQEERIAKRAAEIVRDEVALQIGNGVIKMAVYILTVAAFAAFVWVTGKEFLK